MDEARAAAERIGKGEAFEAIAKERGLSDQDIDLGLLAKTAIADRAIAEAAFALKEGGVSAPVQGRFGPVLLRVVKIEPEKVPTYEEIVDQLRKDLANERAKAEVAALYDKIEDERSLGKPLSEIADNLKLEARTFEFDHFGRDPSGTAVTNVPESERLLPAVFATDIGRDNDPLQAAGGYIWYEVTGITPERDRKLDEVKDQVEARWREDEIANRLKTKASALLEKIKAGGSLADSGLKVETKTGIKRNAPSAPLSEQSVEVIFRTAKGGAATARAEQAVEQLVLRVTEVVVPTTDFNSEATKQLQSALNSGMSSDLHEEYISLLEREIGVTINEKALRQVLSGQNVTED